MKPEYCGIKKESGNDSICKKLFAHATRIYVVVVRRSSRSSSRAGGGGGGGGGIVSIVFPNHMPQLPYLRL